MADSDFDPKAYLAAKRVAASPASDFDPAVYLKDKTGAAPESKLKADNQLEGMDWKQKLMAGLGLGASNIARSAVSLAGHVPGLGGASKAALGSDYLRVDPEFAEALRNDPKGAFASFHVPDWMPLVGGQHSLTPGNVGDFTGQAAASYALTRPLGAVAGKLGLGAASSRLLPAFLARAAPTVGEAAMQGTLLGGEGNRLLGAGTAALGAGVFSAAGSSLGALARGFVKPTAAAEALMREGVTPSLGQMAPGGALSKIEEAGQHSALGGRAIEEARQLPRDQLQRVAAGKAVAPGATLPEGPVRAGDFIDQMHKDFAPAYDELGATPVSTHYHGVPLSRAVREGFKLATSSPDSMASAEEQALVSKFLQNQATILDKAPLSGRTPASGPVSASSPLVPAASLSIRAPVGQWAEAPLSESTANIRPRGAPAAAPVPADPGTFTTAEPLLKMRSNIRAKLRAPGMAGSEMGGMLGNAEDMITKALEERLGPEGAAKLRAADAQYAKLMVLDRAVAASKDSPFGFTPAQLNAAAQNGLSASAKARGYGGSLRDLGALGRDVLDPRAPRTGAATLTLPFGLNHGAGPLMSFLNGPGRNFALGAMGPQRAAASLADMLQPLSNGPSPNYLFAPLEEDKALGR